MYSHSFLDISRMFRFTGRSEDLDEDFANFKSVSIARRRSSVLPTNAVFHHHQDSVGCASYPTKTSCWSRLRTISWWILVIAAVVGIAYWVLPLLDTETLESDSTSSRSPDVATDAVQVHMPYDEGLSSIAEDVDGSADHRQASQLPDIVSDSDAAGSIWFMFQEAVDAFNSLILDRDDAALGGSDKEADEESLPVAQSVETATPSQADESYWWSTTVNTNDHVSDEAEIKLNDDDSDYMLDEATEDERVSIELDLKSALSGQHIEDSHPDTNPQSTGNADTYDSFGWFWGMPEDDTIESSTLPNAQADIQSDELFESKATLNQAEQAQLPSNEPNEPELDFETAQRLQQLNLQRNELRQQSVFDEAEAHDLVDRLVAEEEQLEQLKEARQHLQTSEPEMFECGFETNSNVESPADCNDRPTQNIATQPASQPLSPALQPDSATTHETPQSKDAVHSNTPNTEHSNQSPHLPDKSNPFYEYDEFFNF